MKRIASIVLLMVLMSGIVTAAVTVQAGIFSSGTYTVQVKAMAVGGGVSALVSSIVVPVFWETASGVTLSSVDYAPGLAQTDVGTTGGFSYAVYSMFPNSTVNWAVGSENVILTLTFSGPGPIVVSLQNTLAGSGMGYYFETGVTDLTDYGTPFYAPSTEVSLPVTLTSFTGRIAQSGTGVLLEWATASEVNNYGYTVQRKLDQEGTFVDLTDAFVAGSGTTIDAQKYSFIDKTVPGAGKYEYRLKQQDLSGAIQYTQSVLVSVSLTVVAEAAPREFLLMQNYPNPFNPTTMVKFSVPATGHAAMKVYNMVGQEVVTLFDGVAEAGRYYAVPFNAASMASGVYFYRLVTEKKTDVRRMMLLK
jgi:hypothetical protein